MDKPTEQFTPRQVDEQIARLLSDQQPTLPAARFIQELHHHYKMERQTLENTWERLSDILDERENSRFQLEDLQQSYQPAPLIERQRHMKQSAPGKPTFMNQLAP